MRSKNVFFLILILILSAAIPTKSYAVSREIKITAAASSTFQKNPEWQKEIRDRVLFANQIFEKSFGIRFTVHRFVKWDPQDEKRETNILLQELRSHFQLNPDEIVMGFHKMSQPLSQEIMEDFDTIGTAEYFRGFVIFRDPFQELTALQRQVVMVHEMAHLFGAIHITGENEIMKPALSAQPAMTLDPDNQAIIEITRRVDFLTGVNSLADSEIDQLIQIYEKLIRKNPHSDFYYQLGHFYQTRRLPARAIAVWEEAVRYQYSNPMIHWELGRYYYQNSRFDAAIQSLGSAVAFFILPSQKEARAMAFNFLGVAYYKKGNMELAIFNWLKGLASDPDNLELQGNLAAAYMANGDVDRGISELLKLSAKYPEDETTLSNLGVAYLKKKDYEKVIEYIQKALEKVAYVKMQALQAEEESKIKNKNRKPKKKGKEFQEHLMEDIPEASLRLNLGAAYIGLKDFDKALSELLEAEKLNPNSAEALENLAFVYLRKKNYTAAIKSAREGLSITKENPYLYSFLSEAYAMTGQDAEAVQAAKSGLQYAPAPMRANFRKNMAVIYARSGALPEAFAELKNSLNENWNDADTHLKLGFLYAQSNRFEDAKRSFQNALRVDPNHPEAKKALTSITPKK